MTRYYFNIDQHFGKVSTDSLNDLYMRCHIRQTRVDHEVHEVLESKIKLASSLVRGLRQIETPDRDDVVVVYGSADYGQYEISHRLGRSNIVPCWEAAVRRVWPDAIQWPVPIVGVRDDDDLIGELLEKVLRVHP